MKTVIPFRYLHFEVLGMLEPLLKTCIYAMLCVDPTQDEISTEEAITAGVLARLDGPIDAFNDKTRFLDVEEFSLKHRQLDCQRPLLGICLGAQQIARAVGAKAEGVKEIGFAPLALTHAISPKVLS